jgi:outer membrane lipoprotein
MLSRGSGNRLVQEKGPAPKGAGPLLCLLSMFNEHTISRGKFFEDMVQSVRASAVWVVILSVIAMGCSSSPVGISEDLESHIDKNLTFKEVLTSPESYKGHLILLGGEILKAKRLKKGTQIELLQLPLTTDQKPTTDLTQSQGRVLVLHQDLDPATLTPGTLVTFVGEVNGSIIEKIDEDDYRYPILMVKHWHVWSPPTFSDRRGGPYFGVFGGAGVGGGSRGGGGFGIGF